ncbi:MAG TPA: hypothetical protein VM077_02375 [Candidatus Limnocylindrales bacterium]|nr:hypothetical protein [Candidatus Limnocylindrales bacterium]
MPKKVKTKKQKILADLRLKNSPQISEKTDFTTYSLPAFNNTDQNNPVAMRSQKAFIKHVSTVGYTYLHKDLIKTILLTSSIIIAELVARYYFKF